MRVDPAIPILDVGPLRDGSDTRGVADALRRACIESGFFYVTGHGVAVSLQRELANLSRRFFEQDLATKLRIRMELGGRAWRGYFPIGQELTSGRPDAKEGLYFGTELSADHPLVRADTPLHGPNLFPDIAGFRAAVLEFMQSVSQLGHLLMRGIGMSLGLDPDYMHSRYTADPTILFRVFHYPPTEDRGEWGVGEHTDYGLLTILAQDDTGGLQIRSTDGRWIDAPPLAGSFVCNIGDMLERMTGGLYRSTPHRVRNRGTRGRLALPLFFDPSFDARIEPIGPRARTMAPERWDGRDVHAFAGTYGEYLIDRVSRVFPHLVDEL